MATETDEFLESLIELLLSRTKEEGVSENDIPQRRERKFRADTQKKRMKVLSRPETLLTNLILCLRLPVAVRLARKHGWKVLLLISFLLFSSLIPFPFTPLLFSIHLSNLFS